MRYGLAPERPTVPRPDQFTPSQKKALEIIATARLRRVKHGWQAPGTPLIKESTAQFLGARRLVERRIYDGQPRLELTATGRQLREIIRERKGQ